MLIARGAFLADRPEMFAFDVVTLVAGGLLLGISSFYFASLRNWPILRRHLDAERIRADYAKPED